MSTVISLLMLALALLQQVQANPNLPANVHDEAIRVATLAISEASSYQSDNSVSVAPITVSPVIENTQVATAVPSVPQLEIASTSVTANGFTFTFQATTTIPATLSLYLCSGSTQIEEMKAGNYKGCELQVDSGTANISNTLVDTTGSIHSYYVLVATADGQEVATPGQILQQ